MMDIKKQFRIELGEVPAVTIVLVGVGGTGSFAALHLARLAYVAKEKGLPMRLIFVDPDTVEQKNIGRQNFAPAEIGQPKAVSLARRYNHAFGLKILPVVGRFGDMWRELATRRVFRSFSLTIGAVDSPIARQEIAGCDYDRHTWWLDAGNDDVNGQVVLGNSREQHPTIDPTGFCVGVPLPSVQEPELVAPVPIDLDAPALSCADLLALEAQSLMINQAMAGWLGVYAYRLLLAGDLDIMKTEINLQSGAVRSTPITETKPRQAIAQSRAEDVVGYPSVLEWVIELAEGDWVCPLCGEPLAEGRDFIVDLGEEREIMFCPDDGWRATLDDLEQLLTMEGRTGADTIIVQGIPARV